MSAQTTHGLCLLSLDGGGIKGLSSLFILQKIMESLHPTNPPKPCEIFDMIGGTSTGGLIAIMLGRLRMSVRACIDTYLEISPKIFTRVHHKGVNWRGKMQGRFDHLALESAVKDMLKQQGKSEDELFAEDGPTSCRTFVCATSGLSSEIVVMSDYFSHRRLSDLRDVARIWEVTRATSAATSFFDPITIAGEKFTDGATGANNPINYLWTEAEDVFSQGPGWKLEDHVHCLVSIGTGQLDLTAFDESIAKFFTDTLVSIATNADATAEQFQRHHSQLFRKGMAFRYNVDRGLEAIGLEEAAKADVIRSASRRYIQKEEIFSSISECTQRLKAKYSMSESSSNLICN